MPSAADEEGSPSLCKVGRSLDSSWFVSRCGLSSSTGKKLLAKVQETGSLLSGNAIRFYLSALPIHFRNTRFDPLTSTGEHPTPTIGWIIPRRLSSSLNQTVHSGITGNPRHCAMRYSMNVGSLSHRSCACLRGPCPDVALPSPLRLRPGGGWVCGRRR